MNWRELWRYAGRVLYGVAAVELLLVILEMWGVVSDPPVSSFLLVAPVLVLVELAVTGKVKA